MCVPGVRVLHFTVLDFSAPASGAHWEQQWCFCSFPNQASCFIFTVWIEEVTEDISHIFRSRMYSYRPFHSNMWKTWCSKVKKKAFACEILVLLNNLLVPTVKKYLSLHSCEVVLSNKTHFVNWLGHVFQDRCFVVFCQSRGGVGVILYWYRNPLKIIESLSGENLLYRKYMWKYIANI